MARPVRQTGINGARIRFLRQKEQWSQSDLGARLGVHRATLARWEAGEAHPPYKVVKQMAEIFRVPPAFLFEVDQTVDHEGENPEEIILDPALRRFPLSKLQKYTGPALKVLGFTLAQLTRRLPKLSEERIQELLDGQKPTAYEIQYLRYNLGPEFNPTSSLKQRVRSSKAEGDLALHNRLERIESALQTIQQFQLVLLERVEAALQRPTDGPTGGRGGSK